MLVPFPAGGGTDAFARPLAAQFAKQTGRQLVIDNRGGAGGTLGAGIASRAAPDGYNIFMGAVHHTIAPSMYPKLDYDLEKDLVPLTSWPACRRWWWSTRRTSPPPTSRPSST
jgi:tripartite-type tricarboxylate transporter receptor subunit TctC